MENEEWDHPRTLVAHHCIMPCVFQGTTGSPKGATLSHRNIVNNAYLTGLRLGFTEQVGLMETHFGVVSMATEAPQVWRALVLTQLRVTWRDTHLWHLSFQWSFSDVSFQFHVKGFCGQEKDAFWGKKCEINHFSSWWMLISDNYNTLDVSFEFLWIRF